MFQTKDWKADLDNKKKDSATGKDVVSVYIGDRFDAANHKDPIFEDFYLDVLKDLISDPSKYVIFTSAGSIPQLCVLSAGRIVDHNYQIFLLKMTFHGILNGLDKELMCDALTESCVSGAKVADSKSIIKIQNEFLDVTGMNVSSRLVKALVIEHFRADYSEEACSPVADRLSGYPLSDLRSLAEETNKWHWHVQRDLRSLGILKKDLNASPKDVEKALKDELYLRLLFGKLKEGK